MTEREQGPPTSSTAAAESCTLHMVKGLASAALLASEATSDYLQLLSGRSRRHALKLVQDEQSSLREVIDVCVTTNVFEQLEAGTYQTKRTVVTSLADLVSSITPANRLQFTFEFGGCKAVDDREAGPSGAHDEGALPGSSANLSMLADLVLLRIVVGEVVSNALKYSLSGSMITVRAVVLASSAEAGTGLPSGAGAAEECEGRLRIVIENQSQPGAVLPNQEALRLLFDRGYRGSNATRNSTGLGLSTARKAATAAGGDIEAFTREESSGDRAVFGIRCDMPVTLRTIIGPPPTTACAASSRGKAPASCSDTDASSSSTDVETRSHGRQRRPVPSRERVGQSTDAALSAMEAAAAAAAGPSTTAPAPAAARALS